MRGPDIDPTETREWIDALEGVIEVEGPERARYLLERVLESARRNGAPVPTQPTHLISIQFPRKRRTDIQVIAQQSTASAPLFAGTHWQSCCGRTSTHPNLVDISRASSRRRRSTT
jgi:hypothetical protein